MKKHLDFGFGLLTALSISLAASVSVSYPLVLSQSQLTVDADPLSTNLISQRLGTQPPSPVSNNVSIVDGETWMRGENIPWSTPILVRDSQAGDYMAVFDRNYPTGMNIKQVRQMGEISNWNRRFIGIYGYGIQQSCLVLFFVPICDTRHPVYPVSDAALKIGSRVFTLQGGNSQFTVDDELAYALRTAYPQKVLLRLTLASGSDTVTHPIGEPTVKAWQVIYQDALPPVAQVTESPSPSPEIPRELVAQLPVVDGSTWRINDNLSWSVPVLVKDEFDGDYLAVFDRDYRRNEWNANESGLISDWGQRYVWLHIYEIGGGTSYRTFGVDAVDLKVGDRRFHLVCHNNQFAVTDELVQVLQNAVPGNVQISFVSPEGKTITHRIGDKTVNAWKTVYRSSALPQSTQSLPLP